MQTRIHPDTSIGAVCLNVQLLARSLEFYKNGLGFQIHSQIDGQAVLGAGNVDLLILNEKVDAVHVPGRTGLYHFAILLPSRLQLALNMKQLAETRTPVQGFADHLVSEAIYLADPDGNGIEIYRDRPRDQWRRPDGQLQMGTEPLDIDGIMAELDGTGAFWSGLPPDTRIGHIHLQVSDISAADVFYSDVLGFDFMMHFGPSAGFVSAGGYHHHIGYNTWSSLGAAEPPPDASGLAWFAVELPSKPALENLLSQVTSAGWPFQEDEAGFFLKDSSGNGIILRAI